jgi:hypothetical protein
MKIQVSVHNGEICFRFDRPMRFDVFAVSDAASQVHWDLTPSYMHPAAVTSGFMIGVAVPLQLAGLIPHRNDAASAEEEAVPRVTEIRYGVAPPGYHEKTTARKLEAGKTYALLAFDDRGDSEVIHFSV